jgi:hypothetical protein
MFYAARPFSPTRVLSPRQLPTDHDYAVPTRGYQSDQPSHSPRVLSPALCRLWPSFTSALDNIAPYQNKSFIWTHMLRMPESV